MIIYLVTWENDGDFPDKEIAIVTTNFFLAKIKAKERMDYYYYSIIEEWENDKLVQRSCYTDDFENPHFFFNVHEMEKEFEECSNKSGLTEEEISEIDEMLNEIFDENDKLKV